MNIFFLDQDPEICAQYHCDVHQNKMILECGQLLSTAHYKLGSWSSDMYKPTHKNHPCTIWICESEGNYDYTFQLFGALADEFLRHRGKQHKTWTNLSSILNEFPHELPEKSEMTFPALAMPEEYKGKKKSLEDAVEAYRRYYIAEKLSFAEYKNRETPWFVSEVLV